MDGELYASIVAGIDCGKRVGKALYIHSSAVPDSARPVVEVARRAAGIRVEDFEVVKFSLDLPKVSLLNYPGFVDEGFPTLRASWSVDLPTGKVAARVFDPNANIPVLHRKELMLAADDPRRAAFAMLTKAAEAAGLFDDASIIGHSWQWNEELRARSLRVDGHSLRKSAPDDSQAPKPAVKRHRTALSRHRLSSPMQALWRHGFLDGEHTVFDYGCGRGDDAALLADKGLTVGAWDPHFRPEGDKVEAEVVNLGFVVNVIEDQRERRKALKGAWALTGHVMAVAALIGGRTAYEKYRLFRDGALTSIGTFQKYYSQGELAQYIQSALGRQPIGVAPGVFLVFRNDEGEQSFLEKRQRTRGRVAARTRLPRSQRPRRSASRPRGNRWDRNPELVEAYWERCLELGRMPEDGEFEDEARVRELLGRPETVLRHLLEARGAEEFEAAQEHRRLDLLVYLALNFFERRRSFGSLPAHLQRDVKALWGAYSRAMEEAKTLLFSIADADGIEAACVAAYQGGIGWLEEGKGLHLVTGLVTELPALLRVYVGCAGALYGEVEEADVVKIHLRSGKVSLMICDDFAGKEEPLVIERVKVDLRRQKVRWFDYDGVRWAPEQLIYRKSHDVSASADCARSSATPLKERPRAAADKASERIERLP